MDKNNVIDIENSKGEMSPRFRALIQDIGKYYDENIRNENSNVANFENDNGVTLVDNGYLNNIEVLFR